MNFDIKTEQLGDDAYVISLAGEVDLYTAPEFKQQLLDVITRRAGRTSSRPHEHDLHRLDDARVARRGVKRLRTNDGQLSLVCSDRNITKIFEITGLDRVFTIHATRDEAGRCSSRRPGARRLALPLRGSSWSPPSSRSAGSWAAAPAGPPGSRGVQAAETAAAFRAECGVVPHPHGRR